MIRNDFLGKKILDEEYKLDVRTKFVFSFFAFFEDTYVNFLHL